MDYNKNYNIFEQCPNCFCFGGDLGGNYFCYDFANKEFFAIDSCVMDIEESYCNTSSLYEFIIACDNQ